MNVNPRVQSSEARNRSSSKERLSVERLVSRSPPKMFDEDFKLKSKLMNRIMRNNQVTRFDKLLKSDD